MNETTMQAKPAYRFSHKLLTLLLTAVFMLLLIGSTLTCLYFSEDGYYAGDRTSYAESALCRQSLYDYEQAVYERYFYSRFSSGTTTELERLDRRLAEANTNYRYTMTVDGVTTGSADPSADTDTDHIWLFESGGPGEISIHSYLDASFAVNDVFARQNALFSRAYSLRYALAWLMAAFAVLTLLGMVFLCCAAGRYENADRPEIRNLDRVPSDLYVALLAFALFCIWAGTSGLWGSAALETSLTVSVLAGAATVLLCLVALMSLAARIKTRTLFSNTVVFRVLRLALRLLRWCFRGVGLFFRNLPLLWKTVVAYVAFGLVNVLFLTAGYSGRGALVLLLMLIDGAALVGLCSLTLQMARLKAGGEALASGKLETPIDTAHLCPDLRAHAENLNRVQEGISRAVDERMKSERMKTDLITNVSHDLKTPLTSIVNYVDLLKKENLSNERAAEYVSVLERQAQRLKKLTVDLIEASKASSGALAVQLAQTDMGELLNQSLAEYTERFAAGQLALVCSIPDRPMLIDADGRLLWRVFDNLLSNALKYAQPGTRVYVEAFTRDRQTGASVRNISRDALNISVSELTERFVRGDASRASEGSGLGLTIAKSLTELMHGQLVLSIDGDLFKAEVLFAAAESAPSSASAAPTPADTERAVETV